ncbi:hypothetical protein [Streptomyces smyrnaeus]|uniref:hypothetical protein n=1 Tax=Streptomyces smyrnaeus TaxID=1387713 RepID=UPI003407F7C0
MSKHEDVQQGIRAAFADWLGQHDVSVPDAIYVAAGSAFNTWLAAHSDELITAIAEAVVRHSSVTQANEEAA